MEEERFIPAPWGREPVTPIKDKYMLSIKEASDYFGIGIKLMRRLAENHLSEFAIYLGNRYLIVRPRFEEYVLEHMANGGKEFK